VTSHFRDHVSLADSGVAPAVLVARDSFVNSWACAIIGTSYVPMSRAEIIQHLRGLTDRLMDALVAEPFSTAPADEAGVELVRAHFTGAETLGRTVAMLDEELLAEMCPAAVAFGVEPLRRRLAALRGALATGYAHALRERTLREQEEIRQAVLDARHSAEQALRVSEARFRAMFTEAAIGIGIADVGGDIVEVNQAMREMLGFEAEHFRGRNVRDFMHPDDAESLWRLYDELVTDTCDNFRAEKRFFRSTGEVIWTHLTVSLVRDDDGKPRYQVAMMEDVTERHLLQNRLRYQALHDPLTGLPNRALLLERLAGAFAAGKEPLRVGLCYLDLDGFKVINDSLGHHIGDQLLVVVARRLNTCLAGTGQLVARMGGDEFVILVENSRGTKDVIDVADRVLAALEEPVRLGGHELSVSASIGLVERPVAGTAPTELMRDADITLYWAKADGRARWALFDPERNAREVARFTLSATMPAALERDEFSVEFQPLNRLSDGAVLGVEALVRWEHPEFGRLVPDSFIGLAEETGLIVPLGRWVLRTACQQARTWEDRFGAAAPFVSVNLAVRQSRDPGLVDDVVRILAETGIEAHRLQLELTESAVMGTADEPLDALRALSAMGVRIAIDDFGTGYSNLAYLRHLPVHELKIAGSFVAGLRSPAGADPVDEQIVHTLVTLAHALGLTVTAEGVETAAQADRLRDIGCDAGQGWFFARPGPPESVERLFRTP
jgi:diguanylate cyclase (GGDEF)-like protein/PAS domain S-box-containing protein